MSGRILTSAIGLIITAQLVLGSSATGGDYRGMTAGWPSYANGYYAANYPANYGAGPAYYVARPVSTAAYGGQPPGGTLYAPTRVAYANPTYYAAYGRTPVVYRPVSAVGYPPAAGGYAPVAAGYAPAAGAYYAPAAPPTAYYAPVTANYAPANSYAVSPAGISSGSEAAAYFGQPTAVNYVPPRVAYRTNYAPVPVYMYRPVTAYDPVAGQGVTCLQPSTGSMCQPQRSRCSTWWNPFTWFGSGSCGSGGCGSAPPTTAYCGSGCGQPYYPTAPTVIPVVPGPAVVPQNVIPTTPAFPRTIPSFPVQPTIPPPPTGAAAPGGVFPGTTIIPGTPRTFSDPASIPPSLAPRTNVPAPGSGTFITPIPSQPSTTITPLTPGFGAPPASTPINPSPGGSFQVNPSTPVAPPSGGFGAPGFGSGANYAPRIDPYSPSLAPANSVASPPAGSTPSGAAAGNLQAAPAHSVFGSGYRGSPPARVESERNSPPANRSDRGVIRAPDLAPALPPSVQTVPDLDAPQSPKPVNTAPQLLDPRDKTARNGSRWAVVPAQWPRNEDHSRQLSTRNVTPIKLYQPYLSSPEAAAPAARPQPNAADYDDGGWKSASAF